MGQRADDSAQAALHLSGENDLRLPCQQRDCSHLLEIDPQVVADAFDITVEEMAGRERSRRIAFPRQVAMFLLREETKLSLPQIGESLGGRDHTTIMYGCEKIADLLERDDRLRSQVINIKEQLYDPVDVTLPAP